MRKFFPLIFLCLLCTGCPVPLPGVSPSLGGGAKQEDLQTSTMVHLTTENYRVVKTNVVGTDWGINFLGVIPIVSPDYAKAVKKLNEAGGIVEGKPLALVNVLQQHTAPYFILFSIPKITFRADVVEFTKPTGSHAP